jgi:hypothetical protein
MSDKNLSKNILTFEEIVGSIRATFAGLPDVRTGRNKQYSIEDAALSAFSVFFTQSPSFLEYQRVMELSQGRSNVTSIFGVHNIPCDNQIRKLLDPVSPTLLYPLFWQCVDSLGDELNSMRSLNNSLLVPFDGTQYFSSEKIHCEQCSSHRHKGKTYYFHQVVTPVIVSPKSKYVIPLPPEFIQPQDGHQKQDCELNASKRWLSQWGDKLSRLNATILGDDLYSRQPLCEDILANQMHFILVCKPDSHKTLYEYVDKAKTFGKKRWTGMRHEIDTYRYIESVPLRDGKDALLVNWCELTTSLEDGTTIYKNAFATSHALTCEKRVIEVIQAGRTRWKIENENNNTLKTKGYHFKHNFGHGEKHLAALLATLMILAFLLHTLMELFDENFKKLRELLPSRKRLFQDLSALMIYICFDSWQTLLQFMLDGLHARHPPPV